MAKRRRSSTISRRRFLADSVTGAAAAAVFGRAPAVLGQQTRELQVWHTEVEPQTVKTIQDTSIAEFEKKFPGFKVKQQALGWGDLNTKLLAALAAGSPPDLTHLNPFMTASLYVKGQIRPMDELIRALGEKDIHEATLKLQYFDGKYYGVTHAMGATYFAERRDLREQKGLKAPETYEDMLKLAAALTDDVTASLARISGAYFIARSTAQTLAARKLPLSSSAASSVFAMCWRGTCAARQTAWNSMSN